MNSQQTKIRHAEARDLGQLTSLYNHYVVNTAVTFDLEPITEARRSQWLAQFRLHGRYQLLVAARADRILGYACSGVFRTKQAYETSVEASIYLAPGECRKGLGSTLYDALFARIGSEDVHRAYAGITHPNDASVAIHRKFGFKSIGLYSEVGRKFGRYWDVEWFEKVLP